jgi:DNA-binding transcriptional regulator GbsR (MarR family)
MAVLKPRDRSVYFRISEDEFRQFVQACEKEGARSISDLARSAVLRLIEDCNHTREEQGIAPQLRALEKLMLRITDQLQLLAETRNAGRTSGEEDNKGVRFPASNE